MIKQLNKFLILIFFCLLGIVFLAQPNLSRAVELTPPLLILKGHSVGTNSVKFNSDGTLLVTGAQDETARIWDISSGKEILLLNHDGPVNSVDFSPDGSLVATASGDKTIRLWDTKTGKELFVLRGHKDIPSAVNFSPDGKYILSVADDKTGRIWEVATGKEVLVLQGHEGSVFSGRYSPDGHSIVTASIDGTARIWDTKSGKQLTVIKGHKSSPSLRLMKTMTGFGRPVFFAAFSPDGQKVVTTGGDSTVRIWDAANGKQLKKFEVKRGGVKSAIFSKNESSLLVLTQLGSLQKFHSAKISTPIILLPENLDNNRVQAFDLSPDQKTYATGSVDGVVNIWKFKKIDN